MADIEHSVLTSTELHEPKGVDTAAVDKVYVADGAGSGSWKNIFVSGTEDYDDTGAAQSLGTSYATRTFLTNNGLGPQTDASSRLPGKTDIYDTSTNEFDFGGAGYEIGDHLIIRVDLDITTSATNREIVVGADLAIGTAAAYTFRPYRQNFKTAATYSNTIVYFIFDIGNTFTKDNPAKLFAYSDGSGDTIDLNGFRVFAQPKNPVLS